MAFYFFDFFSSFTLYQCILIPCTILDKIILRIIYSNYYYYCCYASLHYYKFVLVLVVIFNSYFEFVLLCTQYNFTMTCIITTVYLEKNVKIQWGLHGMHNHNIITTLGFNIVQYHSSTKRCNNACYTVQICIFIIPGFVLHGMAWKIPTLFPYEDCVYVCIQFLFVLLCNNKVV